MLRAHGFAGLLGRLLRLATNSHGECDADGMPSSLRSLPGLIAALACASVLAACGEDENLGDCNARIRMDGSAFRAHNELNQAAPVGKVLGSGEVIGCGKVDSAEVVDKVTVYEVVGVDGETAVAVKGPKWSGVYVAEGIPRSEWPAPLEPVD